MRYTVTWLPGVESALASIWTRAADKQAISDASNRIDRLLAVVPLSIGIARAGSRRLVLGPLEVAYTVSVPDCLVEVIYVAETP